MNLSLLSASDSQVDLVGSLVVRKQGLILSSHLVVSWDESVPPTIGNDGVFWTESEGHEDAFDYEARSIDVSGPFKLTQFRESAMESSGGYDCFALDDPFPLLPLIPIAGAIAGVSWLGRRHHNLGKSRAEMLKQAMDKGLAEGRPVRLRSEQCSKVEPPPVGRTHGYAASS